MARKLSPASQPAVTPPQDDGADDLTILQPDITLTIAGRSVTVREYRYMDGLQARVTGKPLTEAITALMASGRAAQADTEDYMDLLAEHQQVVRTLMLQSIDGADAEWLDGLGGPDGDTLQLLWWGVCGRFFVRLALRKMLARAERQSMHASAGSMSSASSPAPSIAASSMSPSATPNVN